MTKAAILGSLAGAFMSVQGAPTVADLNHTAIPVEHIDKSDVSKRHPETASTEKTEGKAGDCNENYPC